MSCSYHESRPASNSCTHCGKWICDDCSIEHEERVLCKECVKEIISQRSGHGRGRHHSPPPPPPYSPMPARPIRGKREYSRFLTFICAMCPGAGHMYLGLIKRGIFILAAFMLSIYLTAAFGAPIGSIAIILIWLTSFFDAFRVLKLKNRGIDVNDSYDDIASFLKKHWVIIVVVFMADALRNSFFHHFYGGNIVSIILVIGVASYFLFRYKGKSDRPVKEEHYDDQGQYNNDEYVDKR